MLWASLYLIITLSSRFSKTRMCLISGDASLECILEPMDSSPCLMLSCSMWPRLKGKDKLKQASSFSLCNKFSSSPFNLVHYHICQHKNTPKYVLHILARNRVQRSLTKFDGNLVIFMRNGSLAPKPPHLASGIRTVDQRSRRPWDQETTKKKVSRSPATRVEHSLQFAPLVVLILQEVESPAQQWLCE